MTGCIGWLILKDETMLSFNGIELASLGIIVQFVNGILDMPKRKGDTEYDWGDEIEPLVNAEDIFFGSRSIVVDAFFDERKGTWLNASQTLEAIIDTKTLTTDFGNYQVRLDEINVLKSHKGGKTLKIVFVELNPDLSGGLPTTTGLEGVSIDGYDLFTHFGLLVENVKNFESPDLKASKETTYKSNALSRYRTLPEITVKVNANYASKAEMSTKINALNALLAKEGMRHFVHRGIGFQCYLPDGYKVDIKRLHVGITLKMKVMAVYNVVALVQEVINQMELQARPQSDLNEADVNQASYIKGKDTFKAADSDKLNGQTADFYAKEAEIKATRDFDFAAELETGTSF